MSIKDKILNKRHTWEITQIYGTLIFIGLTIFFLLMYAVGLQHIVELRFLNLFIMLAGVYYAMMQYRRTHDGQINYFRALSLGTATAFIGATTFGIFLFFFLKFEGNLMTSIQESEAIGRYLNPYIAACAVMLEGVFSGFAVSYILVNYITTDSANLPQGGSIPVGDHLNNEHNSTAPQS